MTSFLIGSLKQSLKCHRRDITALLFVPNKPGHLVRSDILEIRLADCPVIENFTTFDSPEAKLTGGRDTLPPLSKLLAASVGACLLSKDAERDTVSRELSNRLSLPVLQDRPRTSRTVVVLGYGRNPSAAAGVFMAARALKINILALDRPGHWLSKPEYAAWCDKFIPIDRTIDAGLPDRILAAIGKYGKPVHGIVSYFDPLLPVTAVVADRLGLPTAPVTAYEVAADKFKTSEAEGHGAYRLSSLQEALTVARSGRDGIGYPLIIKPCSGWGSEGVFRAENESDLVQAIPSIDSDRHGKSFVVEKYCDGPEVDANLVLCNGELVFFEASDDFPKDGDGVARRDGQLQNFLEVANVLPSALPASEQETLKTSLHKSLLRLGFTSGFFHLEARVQNSRMVYAVGEDGLVDLRESEERPSLDPSAWLIEINARPPGQQAAWASRRTYGVDFWGLSLSFALGDSATARALAVPFQSNSQYWCQIVFIPALRGGVFQSEDVCQELIQRRPDLAGNISQSLCLLRKGDHVPEPSRGIFCWISYYLVFSRTSRQHLLKVAEEVKRETRFEIL